MKKVMLAIFALCLLPARYLFAHGVSESAEQAMIAGGYLQYIWLGASHMLTGYDHLLFLFGVIFFLTRFRDIAKFITAFTLGHCITLIFATFLKISANYFLIDAVIALTVVYKGFDNLNGFKKLFNRNSPNLLVLVFIFGLIHGFGLSTRLQQLPLGQDGLLLRILSFNLGVEVGQVAALSVMLLLLAFWRKTPSFLKFSTLSNTGLVLAGFVLFALQMHGFATMPAETPAAAPVVQPVHEHPSVVEEESAWPDSVWFIVKPGQALEYKFLVEKDSVMEYAWDTDGASIFTDFHGEVVGKPKTTYRSFEKSTIKGKEGQFKAPFRGSHGWYWRNKTKSPVTVTLRTRGSYQVLGLK